MAMPKFEAAWNHQQYTDDPDDKEFAKHFYEAGKRDAVPEGWKLVPVEPTRAMLDAGHCDLTMAHGIDPMLKYAYSQMLDAAPSPEGEVTRNSMICQQCGADRFKEDCKGVRMHCPIRGDAQ